MRRKVIEMAKNTLLLSPNLDPEQAVIKACETHKFAMTPDEIRWAAYKIVN